MHFDEGNIIKKQGINKVKIRYENLLLTKKFGDSVDIVLEQETENGNGEFDVICDMFGNISGNSTVKLRSTNVNDENRKIFGTARLNISGNIEKQEMSIIISIWDCNQNK